MLIAFSCSCSKIIEDDMLTLTREINTSNSLRLDGYYFSEFESDEPRLSIYFLYKNGIALYGDNPYLSDIEEEEEKIRNGTYYELIRTRKFKWGVYRIQGNEIKIVRWYPSERPYSTFLETGRILNDTTFVITQFSEPDGTNIEARRETYRFKALSPKPDSTNMFIQ